MFTDVEWQSHPTESHFGLSDNTKCPWWCHSAGMTTSHFPNLPKKNSLDLRFRMQWFESWGVMQRYSQRKVTVAAWSPKMKVLVCLKYSDLLNWPQRMVCFGMETRLLRSKQPWLCYLLSSMWFRSEIIWHLGKILLSTWSLSNYSQQEMSWRRASFVLPLPIVTSKVSIHKKRVSQTKLDLQIHLEVSVPYHLWWGFSWISVRLAACQDSIPPPLQQRWPSEGFVCLNHHSRTGIHPFCHTTSGGLRWSLASDCPA